MSAPRLLVRLPIDDGRRLFSDRPICLSTDAPAYD